MLEFQENKITKVKVGVECVINFRTKGEISWLGALFLNSKGVTLALYGTSLDLDELKQVTEMAQKLSGKHEFI
jgi:hypothetical protein